MSPILSFQPYAEKTGIYLETAGVGALKTSKAAAPGVVAGRCSGCGRCAAACPQHLFTLETRGFRKAAVKQYPQRCSCCGRCVAGCPMEAISSTAIILPLP
ncbi:MAG: 4Fe-4S dicluster domain-containing protein [Deltaproteobacteria bacterium]|nr:4Fe-4S dicluster domain-containing protein [Deltaproteobacteria bacterium]